MFSSNLSKLKFLGLAFGLVLALSSTSASAQGGSCRDPWINQAFNQLYGRAPIGSGTTSECDITRYGGGHWTTFQDLESKIQQHGGSCRDPWITQAFNQIYRRDPQGSGTSGECNTALYGNGQWSSYSDLVTKIEQHGTGTHTAPAPALATYPGVAPSSAGNGLIRQNPNGIISQDGNGIVAAGGGNLYGVQSVDKPRAPAGKYLVIPGGNLVDANGNVLRKGGTYTLLYTAGKYIVGSGPGARTPTPGTVVTP